MRGLNKEVFNPNVFNQTAHNEHKEMKGLSFRNKIKEAKNTPIFKNVMSNPESNVIKIAEDIIENKSLIEVYGLTKEDFRNFVKDNGEDPYILAAICIELAEQRAKPEKAEDNN